MQRSFIYCLSNQHIVFANVILLIEKIHKRVLQDAYCDRPSPKPQDFINRPRVITRSPTAGPQPNKHLYQGSKNQPKVPNDEGSILNLAAIRLPETATPSSTPRKLKRPGRHSHARLYDQPLSCVRICAPSAR
jgi:hypothetical protein